MLRILGLSFTAMGLGFEGFGVPSMGVPVCSLRCKVWL